MPNISITIKADNADRLDTLAKTMDRSRSWVANEAIEQYLSHQAWMDQKTQEAITDIDAGAALIPHDEAVRKIRKFVKTPAK